MNKLLFCQKCEKRKKFLIGNTNIGDASYVCNDCFETKEYQKWFDASWREFIRWNRLRRFEGTVQ